METMFITCTNVPGQDLLMCFNSLNEHEIRLQNRFVGGQVLELMGSDFFKSNVNYVQFISDVLRNQYEAKCPFF